MKRYDIISSAGIGLLGLLVIAGGLELGFGQWQDPGQGFMPVLAGVLLSFLSALWLVMTIMKRQDLTAAKKFFATARSPKNVVVVLLSLVGYAILLRPLGFVITTFLFLLFLFRAMKPQRWSKAVLTALIVSAACLILFGILLQVQFPEGPVSLYAIRKWIY